MTVTQTSNPSPPSPDQKDEDVQKEVADTPKVGTVCPRLQNRGFCSFVGPNNEACWYDHPDELRRVCKYWLNGQCTSENCKFLHANKEEKQENGGICRNLQKHGSCNYVGPRNEKCKFEHPPELYREQEPTICPFWKTKTCTYEDKCKNLHPENLYGIDNGPCFFWLTQSDCENLKTTGCRFYHGKELRGTKVSVKDKVSGEKHLVDKSQSVCNNYWKTGQCKFGDDCKFAHLSKPATKTNKSMNRR